MNNFKVKNPRTDLEFEIAFTKAHRDAVKKYTHPAQIELACLRAQYPAILHPIQDEDVIAGRVQAGLVGLGIQGQTGGYGYYIDEPRVTAALEACRRICFAIISSLSGSMPPVSISVNL